MKAIDKNLNILLTGAKGFIGKNLCASLKGRGYENIMEYDVNSADEDLIAFAKKADFVFHLAGVNRPKDPSEFYSGNSDLTSRLLQLLEGRAVPVLISSSAQVGNSSDYGKSKELAENALFEYGKKTSASVYPYRLPGVFGKWSRPNYNTVVATFCHNIANGLPINISDENHEINLVYIDDVVAAFIGAMEGDAVKSESFPGFYDAAPVYTVSLGKLASLISAFAKSRQSLEVPCMEGFEKKLYSTYLSYLPEDGFAYPLKMNIDQRGSFTEFLRSEERGQVSVNVIKPGVVKGNHWHHSKNEKFLVVRGFAVIRFRKIGESKVFEYKVNGEKLTAVDIPTGYTHNIENTGNDDLVTVMWANEAFDPHKPDTYYEEV